MATKGKKKGSNTHPEEEYTNDDVRRALQLLTKSTSDNNQAITALIANSNAMGKRLEEVEYLTGEGEGDSFGPKDKGKALSVLADRVVNPDDKMLPQMTETPDRMIMGIVIERARNEFINEHAFNPDSTALFSDIFMKWFAIVMRSRKRALIGEAMGFSQIEMEKQVEEEDRLESRSEG